MEPVLSVAGKMELMKKFLNEIFEDREILEFRNLEDKKFPQVFFQKRNNKYIFTNSMLGIVLLQENANLIHLDLVMEIMEELLINGYKIQNVDLKLKEGIITRGEDDHAK